MKRWTVRLKGAISEESQFIVVNRDRCVMSRWWKTWLPVWIRAINVLDESMNEWRMSDGWRIKTNDESGKKEIHNKRASLEHEIPIMYQLTRNKMPSNTTIAGGPTGAKVGCVAERQTTPSKISISYTNTIILQISHHTKRANGLMWWNRYMIVFPSLFLPTTNPRPNIILSNISNVYQYIYWTRPTLNHPFGPNLGPDGRLTQRLNIF